MLMLHIHAPCLCLHAACPCCMSMLEYVLAVCLCCMNISHEHAACTCCMKIKMNTNIKMNLKRKFCMSVLLIQAACPFSMPILYANDAWPCVKSILHFHVSMPHVRAACPAVYPHCMSLLQNHSCMSLLHVFAVCL
jgi:hypothetical protein